MRFFFDRSMSKKLAQMVRVMESGVHEVSIHDEDGRFSQTTPDVEWISAIASDPVRPVALSGDYKMLKRPDELAAIADSGLTFFIMADQWAKLPFREMAWKFIKVWQDVVAEAETTQPTIFKVCAGSSLRIEVFGDARRFRHKQP